MITPLDHYNGVVVLADPAAGRVQAALVTYFMMNAWGWW